MSHVIAAPELITTAASPLVNLLTRANAALGQLVNLLTEVPAHVS
jgi:hypothetical protein